MELRHIRYFLAIAEEKNFTRAAVRLGIGQPPLSQQIKDLETEVGARLFHRVPHGAELTDAGRAFFDAVQAIPQRTTSAINAAQRAARGEIGSLNLGFTGSAALNPVVSSAIRNYRRTFPNVELKIDETNSSRLAASLHNEHLDVAILRPDGIDTTGLEIHRFPDEPLIAALPRTHSAAQLGQRIDLQHLQSEPLILTPRAAGPTLYDAAITGCRTAGFEPILGPSAPQIASILTLVAAELGVALIPASMRQLDVQGVAYRSIRKKPPMVSLAIAYRRGDDSAFTRNFIAHAGLIRLAESKKA